MKTTTRVISLIAPFLLFSCGDSSGLSPMDVMERLQQHHVIGDIEISRDRISRTGEGIVKHWNLYATGEETLKDFTYVLEIMKLCTKAELQQRIIISYLKPFLNEGATLGDAELLYAERTGLYDVLDFLVNYQEAKK